MTFRVPVGYNPSDLPGQIVDEGMNGRIVDPITGGSVLNPNSDPNETGIDPITGEEYVTGTDQGFGLSYYDALNAGVYNGSFVAGPPDGEDSRVEEIYNEVPYWRYVQDDSGHVRASWVADSDAPSGYAVRFTVTDAADGDVAYFEQIVPVAAQERVRVPLLVVGPASSASANVSTYVELDALDVDGTEIGTTGTASSAWATSGTKVSAPVGLPANSRYLRVRFGVTCSGSFTGPGTIDAREAWAGRPRTVDVTFSGADSTLPASGSQLLNLEGVAVDAAAQRIIAPGIGWVSYIGAKTNLAVLNGDLEVYVWDGYNDVTVGPAAPIPRQKTNGWATSAYDASTNAIASDARLRLIMSVASGTISSTGRDIFATATVTFVIPRDESDSSDDT